MLGVSFGWYSILRIYGLGYKVFKWKNFIYFKLGLSHIIKVKVPKNIKIFFYKSYIFFFSINLYLLKILINIFKKLRDFNFYKAKGLECVTKKIVTKQGKSWVR